MNARVAAPIAMALACVAAPSRADATADAEAAVTKAAADLDAIGASDCPALCKALASLETATKHLCALAKPGDEVDQKRCSDAKGKLEEATKKVRAKCPACAPAPPADLTNAPTNPPTNAPNKPAAVDHDGVSDSQAVGGLYFEATPAVRSTHASRLPLFAIGWSPLRLVSPPRLVALSVESAFGARFSLRVDGAYGRHDGAAAWEVGLQPRWFFIGTFASGLFLGLDARTTHVPHEGDVLVNGWTLAPVLGARLPLGRTFFVGAHAGPAFALGKEPTHRVVPRLDLTLGAWVF